MNRIISMALVVTAISLSAIAEGLTCSVRCVFDENNFVERTFIKGIDGKEYEVKILWPDEYDFLTNRLETAWAFMHSSHENRVKVHGAKVRDYVDEKNAEKITEYKDGYRFVEKMVVKKKMPQMPKRPGNISERHWKARQARKAAEKAAPREVNVIYSANDGTIKEVK